MDVNQRHSVNLSQASIEAIHGLQIVAVSLRNLASSLEVDSSSSNILKVRRRDRHFMVNGWRYSHTQSYSCCCDILSIWFGTDVGYGSKLRVEEEVNALEGPLPRSEICPSYWCLLCSSLSWVGNPILLFPFNELSRFRVLMISSGLGQLGTSMTKSKCEPLLSLIGGME